MKRNSPSISSHDGSYPERSRKRHCHIVKDLDNKNCAWCCYIWGTKDRYIIDALVLGKSLKDSGTRVRMVACVDSRTLGLPIAKTLEMYWEIMTVNPLSVGHLAGTEMKHLEGVYSKLQVWKLFDNNDEWKCARVVMLDVDMMWRGKVSDAIWNASTPAAVMRGNTDSSQVFPRTLSTYFVNGDVGKYERGETKMVGGINAGLIVFTPSTKEFEKMYAIIKNGKWFPRTQMAEQEFLSYYFGKTASWHALGPQYNFQTHQLFLSSDWEPPRGQSTASKYYQMMNDPQLIFNWHFSGKLEPVDCLCDYFRVDDDEAAKDCKIHTLAMESLRHEKNKMPDKFKQNLSHLKLITSVHKQATEEWLHCFAGMYKDLFARTLHSINVRALTYSEYDAHYNFEYTCKACDHCWESLDELQREGQEHVLVDCPNIRAHIAMPIGKLPNLILLPLPPVGKHVIAQLTYLGAVLLRWHRYDELSWELCAICDEPSSHKRDADMLRICLPMYASSYGPLMPPIPDADSEERPQTSPHPNARTYKRRFETAMNTLHRNWTKNPNTCLTHDAVLASLKSGLSSWKGYQNCNNRVWTA